nr:MAG: hypothetical protein E4H34_04210 [Hyphomicrobiales bacterium]
MRSSFGSFLVTMPCLLATFGAAVLAAEGAPSPPQLSGTPNFSGHWTRAETAEGRTFQSPANGPGPLTRAADSGPFWVANIDNPILRPRALEAVRAHAEMGRAGVVPQPAWVQCWPIGVPLIINMNDPIQILQTEDEVTVIHERDNQSRHIYLNEKHPDGPAPNWYGYSVGHYEGENTLVVETRGQNDKTLVDRFGTPRSEKLRVVERYTIDPERASLMVELTIEDPEMFTTPWTAYATYWPAAQFHEQICAENNKDPSGGTFDIPTATTYEF